MAYQYKTVRGLLADRKRWTKGQAVRSNSDGTTSFCLLGAVYHVYKGRASSEAIFRIQQAIDKLFLPRWGGVAHFNDVQTTTHHNIRKVLKEAKV
jgi:hypothetical protein